MSTWAEITRPFTKTAQRKLERIRDSGLWNKMTDEINENPATQVVTAIFVNEYRTASPAYSNYSAEDEKGGRRELFKIIDKYYSLSDTTRTP